METLGRAIRVAGFHNGVPPGAIDLGRSEIANRGTAPCDPEALAWRADVERPVEVYEGGATSPLGGCTRASYRAGTDVLVVRYSDPNSAPPTGYIPRDVLIDMDAAGAPASALFVRALPGARGIAYRLGQLGLATAFFQPGVAPANADPADIDETEGYFDYRLRTRAFHVSAMPDDQDNEPALYEWSADFGAIAQQPIVSGVEQLRMTVGLDDDLDRAVDRWQRPSQITAAQFDRIIALRVGIVIRGDALDDFVDNTTYTLPGGATYTPPEAVQRFPRRLYTQDFQIRNRSRG